MPLPSAPFLSSVMRIEPQWIDYNGHLNMAYYNVMFDRAIDQMWLQLGIGPSYMKERHGSTFTAECHVRYLREIHLGDPCRFRSICRCVTASGLCAQAAQRIGPSEMNSMPSAEAAASRSRANGTTQDASSPRAHLRERRERQARRLDLDAGTLEARLRHRPVKRPAA